MTSLRYLINKYNAVCPIAPATKGLWIKSIVLCRGGQIVWHDIWFDLFDLYPNVLDLIDIEFEYKTWQAYLTMIWFEGINCLNWFEWYLIWHLKKLLLFDWYLICYLFWLFIFDWYLIWRKKHVFLFDQYLIWSKFHVLYLVDV